MQSDGRDAAAGSQPNPSSVPTEKGSRNWEGQRTENFLLAKRLVSFVDFAPTVLSLAGVGIPAAMQGRAFLVAQSGEPRDWIFGGKDRQAECFDW